MPKDQAKIALILQSCLEKIQSGEATLDSVLKNYPDLADTLRPQLETALWIHSQSQVFDPKPEFINTSRERLVRRAKYAVASTPPEERVTFWGWLVGGRQRKLAFQFALTMLLILSLFFSTNRLALAASYTLPGDMLYPIKITHENLRVLFSFTPEGDLELHTDFARQRLVEIEGIILEGRYNHIPATVDAYQQQISKALAALRKVIENGSQRAEELAGNLYRVMAYESRVLGGIYEMSPVAVKKEVLRVYEISDNGLSEMARMPLAIAAIIARTPTATSTQISEITPGETQEATPGVGTPLPSPTYSWWLPTFPYPTRPPWSPTSTPISGVLPTATPTGVSWPTATATPISGTLPPLTATPISGTLPPPTATPVVTNTPLPTNTVGPTLTYTPELPTPTATTIPGIYATIAFRGVFVDVNVWNNLSTDVTITRIWIDWTKIHDDQKLLSIATTGFIWNEVDDTPPTDITSFIGGESLRLIQAGANQNITFRFFNSVDIDGFETTITIFFNDGDYSVTISK